MNTSFLSMIFILFGFNAIAQYSPAEKEYEDYSRKEIRKILLATDENTEYYQLALASKKAKNWGTGCFIASGLFLLGGTYAYLIKDMGRTTQLEQALPLVGFITGITLSTVGAYNLKISRQKLHEAWRLYQKH